MWLLFVVAVWVAVGAEGTPLKPFIIGGELAPEGRYRFLAEITFYEVHQCGGSLITRNLVLTANHCSLLIPQSKYKVTLGEYDNSYKGGEEVIIDVEYIIPHPWDHIDVAIFVLKDPVSWNHTISLATELPPVGTIVTAMGWGWTQHAIRSPAETLRDLDLPIANSSDCNQTIHGLNITEHELCCGKNQSAYTNICHGDSGSPLVYPGNSSDDAELTQIGIAERGRENCQSEYVYASFVNIAHHDVSIWINCVKLFFDIIREFDVKTVFENKIVQIPYLDLVQANITNSTINECRIFYPNVTVPAPVPVPEPVPNHTNSTVGIKLQNSTTSMVGLTGTTMHTTNTPRVAKRNETVSHSTRNSSTQAATSTVTTSYSTTDSSTQAATRPVTASYSSTKTSLPVTTSAIKTLYSSTSSSIESTTGAGNPDNRNTKSGREEGSVLSAEHLAIIAGVLTIILIMILILVLRTYLSKRQQQDKQSASSFIYQSYPGLNRLDYKPTSSSYTGNWPSSKSYEIN